MKLTRTRAVALGAAAISFALVVIGILADAWEAAVLGVALLQMLTLVSVLRSQPAPADAAVRSAIRRLDERTAALAERVALEAQATQRLVCEQGATPLDAAGPDVTGE